MLVFNKANSKLEKLESRIKKKVMSFSLLSGYSCPYAKHCHSQVVDGKIVDGPHTKFRCFSASQEALYKNVFKSRASNLDQLRACKNKNDIIELIEKSFPKKVEVIRIHVAGDFYNSDYMAAWIDVINNRTNVEFYAYTKSLPFWEKHKSIIPKNLSLTASAGGHTDVLITKNKFKQAIVIHDSKTCQDIVNSGNYDIVPSGKYKGLEIDHDDFHAYRNDNTSFALLVHNIMPKGSDAAKAVNILIKG